MRLEGRKILVTGAASGIGFATAQLFLREGANVALLDHNRDGLASAVAHLSGGSRQIASALADVTSEAELAVAVVDASSALGGLDGVVNAAGFDLMRDFDAMSLSGVGAGARSQSHRPLPRLPGSAPSPENGRTGNDSEYRLRGRVATAGRADGLLRGQSGACDVRKGAFDGPRGFQHSRQLHLPRDHRYADVPCLLRGPPTTPKRS